MKTKVLKTESLKTEDIRQIAQILEKGGIIAIPTETVYGLAARVHNDTLRHLDTLKERQQDKRYTLHIAERDGVTRYVPKIMAPVRKIVEKGWPGPITLVFELNQTDQQQQQEILGKETFDNLYSDGTIGIRCPDLPICSKILTSCMAPIVMPSANPSNQLPAVSPQQVLEYFDGKIDLIIDGGSDACRHKKSSAVVKYSTNGFEVLREGIYGREEIFKLATVRILFVCTGNTCRSPMAEALCKKILSDKFGCSIDELDRFGYKVESAGVAAIEGLPASQEAEVVCRQFGISIAEHRSRPLTPRMAGEYDFIFVMSPAHFHACLSMSGGDDSRIRMLDQENEVPDPIGRGLEVYKKCAEQMESAIQERIDEVL